MDWYVGPGASVVTGCRVNTSTCNIRLSGSSYAWTAVYVRQNNDYATLYLLWNSGKTGGTISGYVREKNMQGAMQGVPSVRVSATGTSGGSAVTGSSGFYIMNVRSGRYKVVPSGGPRGSSSTFQPESAGVSITAGSKARADFSRATRHASVAASFAESMSQGGGFTIGKTVDVPVTITAGKVNLRSVSLGSLWASIGYAAAPLVRRIKDPDHPRREQRSRHRKYTH